MRKLLLTGGAGFIGSNIANYIVKNKLVEELVILDNLSTGNIDNLKDIINNVKFVLGDFRDYKLCLSLTKDIDAVCHQGALPNVIRSIENPMITNDNNINGTLNLLNACRENKIKRFVYASSSSVYGGNLLLPKKEEMECFPLSPYSVSKYTVELYSKVYYNLFNVETIGLRYFNVFGQRQNPNSTYSAVIPKFIKNSLNNLPSTINGNGQNSRDFTYIDNIIEANILALTTENTKAYGEVFNIAYGNMTTILELYNKINKITGMENSLVFGARVKGDVENSLSDITKAKEILNYNPKINIDEGLKRTVEWYIKNKPYL